MNPVSLIVYAALGYLAVGLIVGAGVLVGRAGQLDERLPSAPFRVKLILLPGAAVFWPLLLARATGNSR